MCQSFYGLRKKLINALKVSIKIYFQTTGRPQNARRYYACTESCVLCNGQGTKKREQERRRRERARRTSIQRSRSSAACSTHLIRGRVAMAASNRAESLCRRIEGFTPSDFLAILALPYLPRPAVDGRIGLRAFLAARTAVVFLILCSTNTFKKDVCASRRSLCSSFKDPAEKRGKEENNVRIITAKH